MIPLKNFKKKKSMNCFRQFEGGIFLIRDYRCVASGMILANTLINRIGTLEDEARFQKRGDQSGFLYFNSFNFSSGFLFELMKNVVFDLIRKRPRKKAPSSKWTLRGMMTIKGTLATYDSFPPNSFFDLNDG